jgi:hypothetical protein
MAFIHTPNPLFNGERFGVTFVNGRGQTKDPVKIEWFKKKGYKVLKGKEAEKAQVAEQTPMAEEESDLPLVSEGTDPEELDEEPVKPKRVTKTKSSKKKLRKSSLR